MQIPERVRRILAALEGAGYEAYAVGGCVRDSVLGREPQDWDITTSAAPREVKALFRRTVDTGIAHGTVTVLSGGDHFEVTTYRVDGTYSDGRHPDSVRFTPLLSEDLRRRDFTINAMACAADGTIVDLFGGREDLQNRLIRCVGDPDERFTEDALRILRAVRFSAQLDFQIEERTWNALRRHAPNLVHVSRERIFAELNKTILSDHPEKLMQVYEAGISPYLGGLFPGVSADHRAALLARDPAVRWAALCAEFTGERVSALLRGLKSDGRTIRNASLLVEELKRALPGSASDCRKRLSEIGPERFRDLLSLKKLGYGAEAEGGRAAAEAAAAYAERAVEIILASGDCISRDTLAVSGRDLISAGIRPGPEIGHAMDELFRYVLEHPEENRKETLLNLLGERGKGVGK